MQALELRAETAHWDDTETLPEPFGARVRLQLVDGAASRSAPWQDMLQAIPAMRSALVPVDEEEAAGWSKPFSLVKAQFEPWLSYYTGYCSSRLFIRGARTETGHPAIDFPVRALLNLRGIDPLLIIEPPVCIDGPVEYFDASRAPRARRDRGVDTSLARAADAMHRGQLRRACERGQALGNQLHDALLGDGLANLIRAWEKAYRRKPNAHELHLMLTTGRTAPVWQSKPAAPSISPISPKLPIADRMQPRAVSFPVIAPTGVAEVAPDLARVMPTVMTAADRPSSGNSEPLFTQPSHPGWHWHYLTHLAGAAGLGALIYILIA